jgi:hypothetical protein
MMGKRSREIESLRGELQMVKDELERRRVCLFIKVVTYRAGMSLQDKRPAPFSLEDMDARIAKLEKANGTKP